MDDFLTDGFGGALALGGLALLLAVALLRRRMPGWFLLASAAYAGVTFGLVIVFFN